MVCFQMLTSPLNGTLILSKNREMQGVKELPLRIIFEQFETAM